MTPPPTNIDGTDITGATIDGQEVQEITVDGQTVFTAVPDVPDTVVLDFETGDMSQFDTAPNMIAQSSKVFNGSFSGFSDNDTGNISALKTVYSEEQQIAAYEHYQAESSGGNGFAIVLFDGSGNEVLRAGSPNRDIQVQGANGVTTLQGVSDEDWYNLEITFDWQSGTFTATSDNGSSATLNLKSTNGVKTMEIWGVLTNISDTLGSGRVFAWFDDFIFTT
jgi:hypothetical protein